MKNLRTISLPFALAILASVSVAETSPSLDAATRRSTIGANQQAIKDMAASPVELSVDAQPGYVRSKPSAFSTPNSSFYEYSTFQMEETRSSFLLGGSASKAPAGTLSNIDLGLRYRISPTAWPITTDTPWHLGSFPISLSLEAGGLTLQKTIANLSSSYSGGTDSASAKLRYAGWLAVIDELPHGKQDIVIPEVGAGAAYVATELSYINNAYINNFRTVVSPFFSAGFHFFPDHVFSLVVDSNYFRLSGLKNFTSSFTQQGANTLNTSHDTQFDFPSSLWTVGVRVQMKLLWPEKTHAPMLPQLMPIWLLPSYSSEPISPWISGTKTVESSSGPIGSTVGNVFFQYKNRWATKVELIGDFNNWQPERMVRDRSGIWVSVKDVPPGKYRYNYVVEGHREILDPWNPTNDPNSRQGGSSLFVVR